MLADQASLRMIQETPDCTRYRFQLSHGRMTTILKPSGEYKVSTVVVQPPEERGKGIGTRLLQVALWHAKEVGAARITAYIMSRECLQAMRTVFSEDAVRVEEEGMFRDEEPAARLVACTEAYLDMPLD